MIHFTSFIDYLLGNYASVLSIIEAIHLKRLGVWTTGVAQTALAPLHFIIHDKHGNSGIIEFMEDKIYASLNPAHVCTNSPPFEWHLHNLGIYASLTPNSARVQVGDKAYPVAGKGGGFRGIPGDFSPPARFVRTFYGLKYAMELSPPANSTSALLLAGHLLNNVDIPEGNVKGFPGDEGLTSTQWIAVKDLVNLRFLYRTYTSFGFVAIDLSKINWEQVHGQSEPLKDVIV